MRGLPEQAGKQAEVETEGKMKPNIKIMKTISKNELKIGFTFVHQRGQWKITADNTIGVKDVFGCTSIKTNAFVSIDLNEMIEILKIENNIKIT